ncbi:MAG TPA: folylpolyglutamate synthase/dihydrofolate synthase family protein [Candidatus Omnitrophota bacterium]|nr:folylpolyglutamate synthase/dihydrofolate synthase family protein [Candidatus Omnitrophota bacterium]
MSYQEALSYINSFINYEKNLHEVSPFEFRLERVQTLLEKLGNPQKDLKIIHVAGSKGKGSTCAITAQILKCAGYKVGLYTSPHISDIRERIRVLGAQHSQNGSKDIFCDMIKKDEFAQTVTETKDALEASRHGQDQGALTFFEALTAMALYYFRKRQVDFVVLETGLGGRLDATNAVHTHVCAITPISLEHTHILGDTLEKIAHEKAAIIKDNRQRVVLAPQEEEVMDVLMKRCHQFQISPTVIGQDVIYDLIKQNDKGMVFDLKTLKARYEGLELNLLGRHQLVNAAVSIGIIEYLQDLGHRISSEAIRQGLEEARWPGRFEIIRTDPMIILDGAHNLASSKALIDTLKELFPKKTVTVIVGFSQEKDIRGICEEFNRIARNIITTKSHHPRALDIREDKIKQFFPGKRCSSAKDINEAMRLAKNNLTKDDILLVSGSLYLISEARALCTN